MNSLVEIVEERSIAYAVYIRSLRSDRTKKLYSDALGILAEKLTDGAMSAQELPWHEVRYVHLQTVMSRIEEEKSASTAKLCRVAARGVMKQAWKLGLITNDQYLKCVDIPVISCTFESTAGRELSKHEIKNLFIACRDHTICGVRDAAIISLLYYCGMRRSEITSLDYCDYNYETGEINIRQAKHGGTRSVFVCGEAKADVDFWCRLRGDCAGPMFYALSSGDVVIERRISGQTVYDLLKKRGLKAGVKNFSPHDMRRSCASHMFDAGVDIVTVKKMLGHKRVDTTAAYDRRGDKSKIDAVEALMKGDE